MADHLSTRLHRDLAERLMDAAISTMTDDEMDAILNVPGEIDLSQCSDAQLDRLAAGEDPLVVLGPDWPRNP